MRNFVLSVGVFGLIVGLGSVAVAKGAVPAQNHHCVKDGATLEGKTKRECKKEGGTWEKDAAAAKPGDEKPAAEKPAEGGGKPAADKVAK